MRVPIRCLSSINILGFIEIPFCEYVSGDKIYIPVEGIQIELKIMSLNGNIYVNIPFIELIDRLEKSTAYIKPES